MDVLVIGAGVCGLTTGICLAEAGRSVTIRTAAPPERTTSVAAGALWGLVRVGPPDRVLDWGRTGLEVMSKLAAEPGTGVRMASGREVSRTPMEPHYWTELLPGLRLCDPSELPDGFTSGWHYTAPLATMPVYLGYLRARFEQAGGRLEVAPVRSLAELAGLARVVVNCAGVYARDLVPDPEVGPVRGQVVIVANPGLKEFFINRDEEPPWITYMFPHGEEVLLGGTNDEGNWNEEPEPFIAERIVAHCAAIDPRLRGATILGHRVGLRPYRPEVRLESEPFGDGVLWHNYGHGGAGISLSWGCAAAIAAGVAGQLSSRATRRAVAGPLGDLGQGQADRAHPFGQVSRHLLPPLRPPHRRAPPRDAGRCHRMPTSELALRSKPVLLRRLALAAIAALAALSYAWALGHGSLEYYYGAAVRSMSMSWHNFIFGAFDPAGTITLDKLPGAFWFQALSVRAFGMHPWAIVLPQVIEGVLTVLVLYRAVSRLAGPAAGLIAALILAVSPATVALDRGNISDTLMILLLVLAADAVSAAIAGQAGRFGRLGGATGRLILAGVWVGLAFQAKMIEAWMVLPALGLAYLLAGPGSAVRRVGQLVIAGAVAGLVSVAWMTAVSLVPAADRPYVDGSHDDSVFEQVFSYNGFGRFGDQTPLQLLAGTLKPGTALPTPPAAPDRLLRGNLGRDTGWLIPAAAVVGLWGLASRRRQPRSDPLRACFVLWGAWLVTLFAVFSVITTINAYYTAALSPPVAAIIGAGAAAAWSAERTPVTRSVGLGLVVAGTAGYAAWLVHSSGNRAPGWLVPALIVVAVAAIGVSVWSLLVPRAGLWAGALAAGLVSVALVPAVASASLAAHGDSAFDTPFESARTAEAVELSGQVVANANIAALQNLQRGAPWVMAAQTAVLPSVIIYDSGLEALPIGGLTGTIPSPSLSQLQADIRAGRFHLVWIATADDPRLKWIATHCLRLSKRYYWCGTGPGGPRPVGTSTSTPVGTPVSTPVEAS